MQQNEGHQNSSSFVHHQTVPSCTVRSLQDVPAYEVSEITCAFANNPTQTRPLKPESSFSRGKRVLKTPTLLLMNPRSASNDPLYVRSFQDVPSYEAFEKRSSNLATVENPFRSDHAKRIILRVAVFLTANESLFHPQSSGRSTVRNVRNDVRMHRRVRCQHTGGRRGRFEGGGQRAGLEALWQGKILDENLSSFFSVSLLEFLDSSDCSAASFAVFVYVSLHCVLRLLQTGVSVRSFDSWSLLGETWSTSFLPNVDSFRLSVVRLSQHSAFLPCSFACLPFSGFRLRAVRYGLCLRMSGLLFGEAIALLLGALCFARELCGA